MTLTRWQPFQEVWSEMNRMHDEMNKVFGRSGNGVRRGFAAGYPALNVWEDEQQFRVTAELPGLSLEDLEILVQGDSELTIQGERKAPESDSGIWHRRERGFGKFTRSLHLPSNVDAEKVEASLKHGVLEIVLPKREEAKPRRIEVKTS